MRRSARLQDKEAKKHDEPTVPQNTKKQDKPNDLKKPKQEQPKKSDQSKESAKLKQPEKLKQPIKPQKQDQSKKLQEVNKQEQVGNKEVAKPKQIKGQKPERSPEGRARTVARYKQHKKNQKERKKAESEAKLKEKAKEGQKPPPNQPANQLTNQPVNQPANQPANQSANQPPNPPRKSRRQKKREKDQLRAKQARSETAPPGTASSFPAVREALKRVDMDSTEPQTININRRATSEALNASSTQGAYVPAVNWNAGSRPKIRTTLGSTNVNTSTKTDKSVGNFSEEVISLTDSQREISRTREGSGDGTPESTNKQATLLIRNLPSSYAEKDVMYAFRDFKPSSCYIPRPKPSNFQPSDPAFVYVDQDYVYQAIAALHGQIWEGHRVTVMLDKGSNSHRLRLPTSSRQSSPKSESDGIILNIQDSSDKEDEKDDMMIISNSDPKKSSEFLRSREDHELTTKQSVEVTEESNHSDEDESPGSDSSEESDSGKENDVRTLADLSPEALNMQFRYTAIMKSPQDIDLTQPVTCLLCGVRGHMAETCSELKCSHCGVYDEHISRNCPTQPPRCGKCGETGHAKSKCQFKLKRTIADKVTCQLCQRHDHLEHECELIWKTFRPMKSSVATTILLFCSLCGNNGHLNGDCSQRLPGQPLRSTTWTNQSIHPGGPSEPVCHIGNYNIPTGRSGARGNEDVIVLSSDSEDDPRNFYGPKVNRAPQPGGIRIKGASTRGEVNGLPPRPPNALGPYNGQYPNPSMEYRERENNPFDQYQRRRSRSPLIQYPGRTDSRDLRNNPTGLGFGGNGDYWQPPLPDEPTPSYRGGRPSQGRHGRRPAAGESYRPMPSSGRAAWRQHNV
ncbi:MAG: hypothetical protein M1834_001276 [Cirrosporium novae-zelandiae]|nr:MAG: hypothetical protein M1834_001276 [Cirrosporium novae-zelandiae]